jgi:hypothetical protein
MAACEASGAREHGHDSKQRQVEGPIMQAIEWTREFGWCKLSSTWAQKSQSGDDRAGGKTKPGGQNRPRPVGPGRPTL